MLTASIHSLRGNMATPAAMDVQSGQGLQDLPSSFFRALLQEHLGHRSKLHLFQASTHLAATIIRHVDSHVRLALDGRQEQGGSIEQQESRGRVLQGILSSTTEGCSIHVEMLGQVSAAWQYLPKDYITHLTLNSITLSEDLLQTQLQLQQCTRLHTLTLRGQCSSQLSATEIAAWQQQQPPTVHLPSTLAHLELLDGRTDYASFAAWAQLLSPHVTNLTVHPTGLHELPACPCITHLHLPNGLTDGLLDHLTATPHITHVTASRCHFIRDHSNQLVNLQQLEFTHNHWGPDMSRLLRLPVSGIQQVIIHHLHCDYHTICDAHQAHARLITRSNLRCVPKQACRPGLPEPTFMLRGAFTPGLIEFCGRNLTGDGCLVLDVSPAETHMLQGIAQLPSHIHKLCLGCYVPSNLSSEQQLEEQAFWQQLPAALPAHISELVLDLKADVGYPGCASRLAAALPALQAAGRLEILTVLLPCELSALPVLPQTLLTAHQVRVRQTSADNLTG